jgi:hypothetical protein
MPRKHTLPAFLTGKVSPDAYERWLGRKAQAHVKRDRARGNPGAMRAQYKEAIHAAVLASRGVDAYSGDELDWSLISTYRNEDSKASRSVYKAKFAKLPTVDHCLPGGTEASFCICGWGVNDAKNDLSLPEFVALCRRIIAHADKTRDV